MAINIKKGNGLTLAQSSKVGALVSGQNVIAGMVVNFDNSESATSPSNVSVGSHATRLIGIALNSYTDSDVIGSNKIAALLLDGSSVIETDQTDTDINTTNYTMGATVYGSSLGLVTTASTISQVIGKVTGVRSLPAKVTVGSTVVQSFKNFLSIKLAA